MNVLKFVYVLHFKKYINIFANICLIQFWVYFN